MVVCLFQCVTDWWRVASPTEILTGRHSERLRICEHRDAHLRAHHGKLNSISNALTRDRSPACVDAIPVLLKLEPSSVLLGYSIYKHGMPATAQMYDAAIAIGFRILREIGGPTWRPLAVQLAHQRPDDVTVDCLARAYDSMQRFRVSRSRPLGSITPSPAPTPPCKAGEP